MTNDAVRGWLKIRGCSGVGDVTLRHLMEAFSSPHAVLDASRADLIAVEDIRQEIIDQIPECMPDSTVDDEFNREIAVGCDVVTVRDSKYPEPLKAIHDAPPVLFTRGFFEAADRQLLTSLAPVSHLPMVVL